MLDVIFLKNWASLWAISPETPVSISSKTKMDNFDFSLDMYLKQSIIREISPPEATDSIFFSAVLEVELNWKEMSSTPKLFKESKVLIST